MVMGHFALQVTQMITLSNHLWSMPRSRFFLQAGVAIGDISSNGLLRPIFFSTKKKKEKKKEEHLGMLISKPARNIYKVMENINYSHRMSQVPRVLEGLLESKNPRSQETFLQF